MAFLKVDKKATGQYIRIVENKRTGRKVKTRTLYTLGKVSDYTPAMLKRMGERLYELGGGELKALVGGNAEELGRYNYGFYQAVMKVMSHYQLDMMSRKLEFNLLNTVVLLLVERLCDPVSKRSNYINQHDYIGLEPVALQHLYRSLDYLAKHSQLIQNQIFQTSRNLFNQNLDVVFYDVTTFYFDSDKAGGLRQKGFSKDGKQGKVQVLFGLLLDKHRNPVGYRIYKGDTFEGHTFQDAITTLKQTYQIDKIIVVADRGMLSRNNIELTTCEETHYEFIVGERLKVLPEKIQKTLLNINNYKKQWIYDKNGEAIIIKYATIQYKTRTIIGTWSQKRADKDRHEREEKIEKAEKLLKTPSNINRKASRFFIKMEDEATYTLDQEKINQSKKYDGFLAISTNNKTLHPADVLDNYRHLFLIEQTFRTFKTHLETRPMFHWTDKRIEGHICLCYMAYAIQNYMLAKMQQSGTKLSENKLRRALTRMQVSLIRNNGTELYLRSAMDGHIPEVVNKLGLKRLPSLMPKSQITNYL